MVAARACWWAGPPPSKTEQFAGVEKHWGPLHCLLPWLRPRFQAQLHAARTRHCDVPPWHPEHCLWGHAMHCLPQGLSPTTPASPHCSSWTLITTSCRARCESGVGGRRPPLLGAFGGRLA